MHIIQKTQCVVLADEYTDIEDFATYINKVVPAKFNEQNIVLDLLKYDTLILEDLVRFLEISNTQRAAKHSFVFVNEHIDYDVIPDELIVVPTVLEAEDIIEMEEIERDLGF